MQVRLFKGCQLSVLGDGPSKNGNRKFPHYLPVSTKLLFLEVKTWLIKSSFPSSSNEGTNISSYVKNLSALEQMGSVCKAPASLKKRKYSFSGSLALM